MKGYSKSRRAGGYEGRRCGGVGWHGADIMDDINHLLLNSRGEYLGVQWRTGDCQVAVFGGGVEL